MINFPVDNPRTNEFIHSHLPGLERLDKFAEMFVGNELRVDDKLRSEYADLINEVLMFGLNMAIVWREVPAGDGDDNPNTVTIYVRHLVIW